MGWFSSLFAVDKAAENILDKDKGLLTQLGGWVGGFSHTEQEKAEDAQATRKWATDFLTAMAPFKIMQRIMVTIIMSVWAFYCLNMSLAIWIYSNDVVNDLMAFIQTPFVWVPVSGAVTLYLMGGVMPSRSK
jgi:hypothetical protein